MESSLFKQLARGATLVTANNRLERLLRGAYDREQHRRGNRCWPTPRVCTLTTWAGELWRRAWTGEAVLSGFVRETLWEEAVRADAALEGVPLLDQAATARKAMEADLVCHLYEIPFSDADADTPEARGFLRWRARYEERLQAGGWTDPPRLWGRLATMLVKGGSLGSLPATLLRAGFDEFPPAQRRFFAALEELGVRVEDVAPTPRAGRAALYTAADPRDEVEMAARWACRVLQARTGARLAVVAVDMQRYGPLAEQTFARQFTPTALLGEGEGKPRPYGLSLGRELSNWPVVHAALELLHAGRGPVPWERWRSLLLSPFWQRGAPQREVAGLVRALGEGAPPRERLDELTTRLERAARDGAGCAEGVGEALRGLRDRWRAVPSHSAPSAWANYFLELLEAAGWGGRLSSEEFQALEAFEAKLLQLGTLDGVAPEIDLPQALERLARLCASPFQPEGGDPPVQVMGMLEAAGRTFDALWLLGAEADALPVRALPDALIPYALQKRAGVRHADPQSQLRHGEGIAARLLEAADELVVSFPKTRDGAECRVSPLVAQLPPADDSFGEALRAADRSPGAQLRALGQAPLVSEVEALWGVQRGEAVRLNNAALADQAECPFRAFARHRLGLRRRDEADDGLDAPEQGTAIHEALHRLTLIFPDRTSLEAASLEGKALEEGITAAVGAGLATLAEVMGGALPARLAEVEGERIRELLRSWVASELERPEFAVVEREAARQVVLDELRREEVNVRLDRVDEVEEGRMILDYKTGSASSFRKKDLDLENARPGRVQLPLYALADPEARAVGYAFLDRGQCNYRGISVIGGLPRGIEVVSDEKWSKLRAHWRVVLEGLAGEFREGRAAVDPQKGACDWCELAPLCRLEEVAREGEGDA